jgi:putative membrane protein insertion efficiency factor
VIAAAGAVARVVGWPFRFLLTALIVGYRRLLSPLMPPRCKYHPSCSTYALAAVERHGAAKGLILSTWRLLRCNPFSKGGFDPVPARGQWLPDVHPDGRPRTRTTPVERQHAAARPSAEGL